jgi:hypothetical protein
MNKDSDKKYDWDIAISLCKEDSEFAVKLIKALNPELKVFFYENNQEELISKSGPEAFAKIFKEKSRIIVILSRKEWSESYYTDIERNAIIDRTSVKNEGFQFLLILPMVPNEIPNWYPSTRIYIDPFRFTIEQIAKFIEFKFTDEGGNIKPLTIEDQYKHLLNRINEKRELIKLQISNEAIIEARKEILILKESFNKKSKFLRISAIEEVSWFEFNENVSSAFLEYGKFGLECKISLPDEVYNRIVSTQDFMISFILYDNLDNSEKRKIIDKENRVFYYSSNINSWALGQLYNQPGKSEKSVLFNNGRNPHFYNLVEPLTTSDLIERWFQKLLSKSTEELEKLL